MASTSVTTGTPKQPASPSATSAQADTRNTPQRAPDSSGPELAQERMDPNRKNPVSSLVTQATLSEKGREEHSQRASREVELVKSSLLGNIANMCAAARGASVDPSQNSKKVKKSVVEPQGSTAAEKTASSQQKERKDPYQDQTPASKKKEEEATGHSDAVGTAQENKKAV